jgi:hypothetical protein
LRRRFKMLRKSLCLGAFAALLLGGAAVAQNQRVEIEPTAVPKSVEKVTVGAGTERVSGLYKVGLIETKPGNEVIVHFESEPKDGVHDLLVLKSDGLNVKIEKGQILKLSAEVLQGSQKEHEITQVLVFLPSSEYGLSPVWLLSKTHETREIKGARYLEMHAPGSDFQIL